MIKESNFIFQENQYKGALLPCTLVDFNQSVDSPDVAWRIGMRQKVDDAIADGLPLDDFLADRKFLRFCQNRDDDAGFQKLTPEQKLTQWTNHLKMGLPCFIFGASSFDTQQRSLSGIYLSGFFMFDADHLPMDPREIFERTQVDDFPWKTLLGHRTSSGHGLRLVCEARPVVGNIADNQIELARELGLLGVIGTTGKPVVDNSCIDASRISYCPRREDIYYIDEETLFNPVAYDGNSEYSCLFDEKYREDYRAGRTAPTNPNHSFDSEKISPSEEATPSVEEVAKEEKTSTKALPEVYGHPVMEFIDALLPNGVPQNSRHKTALKLADDLIIMLDGDRDKTHQVLLSLKWVQDVISERPGNEIKRIVDAAEKHMQKREEENLYAPQPSKRMRKVIEQVTKKNYRELTAEQAGNSVDSQEDIQRYTNDLGKEIGKLFRYYPLLKLLCHGMQPKHYVAAMFAGSAFAMTLMTRCWYRFYGTPGRKCRLNCIFELIGPPGSGKGFLVDLYRIMMEPIKKSDEAQIKAINDWKEEQNTKGANKDKSACPQGVLRCLPAESSAASIRDAMMFAKEEVDGEEWPLHVFLFDSELDNTIRQMKKDYMDITSLYLKAFHNEPHGSMLKTTSAKVGEYDVHMNCVYSGTDYALNKQINVDNYTSGLHFRLTLILMAHTNYEMMEKKEYTVEDTKRDALLREWAYKLDSCKGEIPVKMLSDKLYEWTSNRMKDAEEDNSNSDEDLLKRCAWHGINYAIPLVVSRHWSEMTEDNGRMKPGVGFKIDKIDWKLCQLIANTQYAFQRYFVGPIAEKFHDNRAIEAVSSHHLQNHTKEAYTKLPQIFSMDDVIRCYGYSGVGGGCSRLKRLQDDGLAQKIRSGADKGKYRKLA